MCPFFSLSSDKILGSLQESFNPLRSVINGVFRGPQKRPRNGQPGLEPYLGVFTPLRTGRGPSCSSSKGHANWRFPIWTSTGFFSEMNLRQKARMLLSFLVLLDAWQFSPQKPQSCRKLTPENSGFSKAQKCGPNESTPRAPIPVISYVICRIITPFILRSARGPPPCTNHQFLDREKRRFCGGDNKDMSMAFLSQDHDAKMHRKSLSLLVPLGSGLSCWVFLPCSGHQHIHSDYQQLHFINSQK